MQTLETIIKQLLKERLKMRKIYREESRCLLHDALTKSSYIISLTSVTKEIEILRKIKQEFYTNKDK